MVTKQVILTFDKQFYTKALAQSTRKGYKNIQQYTYDLLHHAVYSKKNKGGRPVKKTYDDIIMKAITKPTAKSRKLEAWAKKRGIWR